MFRPYSYKQLVVKCDYVLQQVQTLSCCNSLNNNNFFLQLPAFTCYFHCSLISYHFIHSLLMTHFTSNYYYTLKIACVSCIFAFSYSLSHPVFFNYNPPYGKRWRLYILPQFLSNLTRPITHKVISIYIYIYFFFLAGGRGGGGAILGLELIKLFCAFL